MTIFPTTLSSVRAFLGGGFTSKRGVFGKAGKLNSMLSVTYGPTSDLCYSGGADGRVYHWRGSTLTKTVAAHKGPVYAMQRVEKASGRGYALLHNIMQWDTNVLSMADAYLSTHTYAQLRLH